MFGSAGSLNKEKTQGRFVIPTEAYRDEGISYHYAPPSDYIKIKNHEKLADVFNELHIPYVKGKVWTTDAFLCETAGQVAMRQEEGCIAVDIAVFSAALLITALTACSPDFNGSRIGNDDQLIMEYTTFNTTDSQELVAKTGDVIHVKIVVDDGQLSYKIQKNDDEPLAESEGIFFSVEYDVDIEENGTYTVTVTGEKAKGSVEFVVESAE